MKAAGLIRNRPHHSGLPPTRLLLPKAGIGARACERQHGGEYTPDTGSACSPVHPASRLEAGFVLRAGDREEGDGCRCKGKFARLYRLARYRWQGIAVELKRRAIEGHRPVRQARGGEREALGGYRYCQGAACRTIRVEHQKRHAPRRSAQAVGLHMQAGGRW